MANIIKIKQGGTGVTAPAAGALKKGELGYTFNNDKLWVGSGDGNTDDALLIGGKLGSAVQAYDANIVSDATYQSTANDFTTTLKTKLDGIETSATADQTNAEIKTAYEANANSNEFSDAEQTKLSGIATSANNYSHPTSAGNKHIPTGGASGQFLKYSASGTAVWASDNNTTYSVGDGGLTQINFTSADNTKLDGIETGADVNVATNLGESVFTFGGADFRKITSSTGTDIAITNATSTTPGMMSKVYASKLDGIEASADVTDTTNVVASLTAGTNVAISAGGTISSTYTDTTYSVGDGGLTQNNFTDALKSNYDASYNWYTTMTTSDADSVIDTVNEIVSAFQNHAEGLNLISELDAKLTADSIIDGGTF